MHYRCRGRKTREGQAESSDVRCETFLRCARGEEKREHDSLGLYTAAEPLSPVGGGKSGVGCGARVSRHLRSTHAVYNLHFQGEQRQRFCDMVICMPIWVSPLPSHLRKICRRSSGKIFHLAGFPKGPNVMSVHTGSFATPGRFTARQQRGPESLKGGRTEYRPGLQLAW